MQIVNENLTVESIDFCFILPRKTENGSVLDYIKRIHLDYISKTLGHLTCQYDKTILIGDFDLSVESNYLENFMITFDSKYLIKKPATCFQSSNQHWIDLILTNKKELFKNIDIFEVESPTNIFLT